MVVAVASAAVVGEVGFVEVPPVMEEEEEVNAADEEPTWTGLEPAFALDVSFLTSGEAPSCVAAEDWRSFELLVSSFKKLLSSSSRA